jgi:hypothetical protein
VRGWFPASVGSTFSRYQPTPQPHITEMVQKWTVALLTLRTVQHVITFLFEIASTKNCGNWKSPHGSRMEAGYTIMPWRIDGSSLGGPFYCSCPGQIFTAFLSTAMQIAQCPVFSVQCPVSSVQCPVSSVQCPVSDQSGSVY